MSPEAAAWTAVAQVGDGVCKWGDGIGLPGKRVRRQASGKGFLELANAVFDGPVVRGVIRRTVERDDAVGRQELVYSMMIEDCAVVPL